MSGVTLRSCFGDEVRAVLDEVAALRIEVFREYPYLYDGTVDYEARYLTSYAECDEAVIVVAEDEGRIVGASTALPLLAHSDDVLPAFANTDLEADSVYYFGESVLRRSYRAKGLGNGFFDKREEAARKFGRFTHTAFCAVVRPDDHPKRPADYRPLDAFWIKRGYVKQPNMIARFDWKEVGEATSTPKDLVFWIRPLQGC